MGILVLSMLLLLLFLFSFFFLWRRKVMSRVRWAESRKTNYIFLEGLLIFLMTTTTVILKFESRCRVSEEF